jgi:hypothetical protein
MRRKPPLSRLAFALRAIAGQMGVMLASLAVSYMKGVFRLGQEIITHAPYGVKQNGSWGFHQ